MEKSEFRLRCLSAVFRVWISIRDWTGLNPVFFFSSMSLLLYPFEGFNVPPQLLLLDSPLVLASSE